MKNKKSLILSLIAGVVFLASPVVAGELTYQPVNPNFGGSPFNGAPLLNSANAVNNFTQPTQNARDSARDFAERLDRAILSQLSRTLTTGLINDDGTFNAGTFQTGVNTIVVGEGAGGTTVTITNNETGEISVITIPSIQ